MKILIDDETKKILGASILGIEGDEIIHLLLDITYAELHMLLSLEHFISTLRSLY